MVGVSTMHTRLNTKPQQIDDAARPVISRHRRRPATDRGSDDGGRSDGAHEHLGVLRCRCRFRYRVALTAERLAVPAHVYIMVASSADDPLSDAFVAITVAGETFIHDGDRIQVARGARPIYGSAHIQTTASAVSSPHSASTPWFCGPKPAHKIERCLI